MKEPCEHPGCLNHVSHPCENCGRVNGIDRGDRLYNGLPSELMNEIYDGLIAREEDLVKLKGWAILSLYLARTCNVLERRGWKKS